MKNSYEIPDPSTIRQTAQEIVQSDDYQLETVSTADDTLLLEWILRISRWLWTPFEWLFNAMEGIPDFFRWFIIIALIVILILLITHIIYTFVMVLKGVKPLGKYEFATDGDNITPELLESQAETKFNQKDYIFGIRLLFQACLLRLAEHEKKSYSRGMTNRQHLKHFKGTPVFQHFQIFVQVIDYKWYGMGECHEEDYHLCREAHYQIRDYTIKRS